MNSKAAVNAAVSPHLATITVGKKTLSSYAFIAGLLIYALYSAPFPANPGLTEFMIASLFMLFVNIPTGILVMSGGFTIYQKYGLFPVWIHVGFFLLLWWGLYNGGVVYHWQLSDIVRDLIPCVYIFVPLLLLPAMQRSRLNWQLVFPWVLSAVGVILSIRFFFVVGISPLDIGKMSYFDNFLYLPYDPTVSFAGIFLPIMAVHTWKSTSFFRWMGSLLMITGGFLCLGSLMAVAQRAPLGMAVFSFFIYFMLSSRKSLKKMILFLIILITISVLAKDQIVDSYDLLVAKQENYGANGKTNEMRAVLNETSDSVYSLLFGIGWGGLFFDPTYQSEVSFTHSAVTFFLLKGGVLGVLIFLYYLSWITYKLLQNMKMKQLPYLLSAIVPLTIGLVFQPSFKTLTYGMMITFLCLLFSKSQEGI